MTEAQLLNEKKSKKSKIDLQRAEFQEWMAKNEKTSINSVPDPVQILHDLRVSIECDHTPRHLTIRKGELIENDFYCSIWHEYPLTYSTASRCRLVMLSKW